jgi:putative Ca2+/H+ antiporter (TMEM165/GDT1 family)
LEAFFVSTGVVALAEIGDKTQLLALLLAARYRTAWPIVLGIMVAAREPRAGQRAGQLARGRDRPHAMHWILTAVHRHGDLDAT